MRRVISPGFAITVSLNPDSDASAGAGEPVMKYSTLGFVPWDFRNFIRRAGLAVAPDLGLGLPRRQQLLLELALAGGLETSGRDERN
ncbi:MAG: hypothetical protein HYZ29_01645 [Myxococcales bacterium]|nr:hypothetical protein [Myxococcales bacterium]